MTMAKRPQNQRPNAVKASSEPLQKKRQRTARVCDRCRVKKLKCDGGHCRACLKSDSVCLYTHPRRNATKNHQWQMRDIMNEGLRTLYLACKRNSCFPGQLPEVAGDDDDNNVSIHAIIQGLGLIPIPNELNFPGGHQMALEDEGHGLGLNENSDRDLSPSKRPELMDEPNGESLPRRHEAKEEHLIDGGGQSVRTQGNPSQCGSLTSSSFVKRPLSALAGDSIVSFSDPLFPHFLLTSPVDKIHDDVRDDDGSYDEDVPIVDQHLGFTQQPNLAESTYSPKSPQTAGMQDSAAPTETELGSSYLAEREHFYQNLFSLPRGSLVDMQQNFWPLPSEDPAPSWDGVLAQLFIV